jgi:hypothetical protein
MQNKPARLALALLCIAVVISDVAKGQCNELPPSMINGREYSYQPRIGRCEGYVANDRQGSFVMARFTYGYFNYDLTETEIVSVFATVPTTNSLTIRSTSLKVKDYYQMEGQAQSKLTWPVKDVLFPSRLSGSSIGLYGFFVDNRTVWHTPVKYSTKSGRKIVEPNIPFLHILAVKDMKNIECTVYSMTATSLDPKKSEKMQVIRETEMLKLKLDSLPSGRYKVIVNALDRRTGTPTPSVEFLIMI